MKDFSVNSILSKKIKKIFIIFFVFTLIGIFLFTAYYLKSVSNYKLITTVELLYYNPEINFFSFGSLTDTPPTFATEIINSRELINEAYRVAFKLDMKQLSSFIEEKYNNYQAVEKLDNLYEITIVGNDVDKLRTDLTNILDTYSGMLLKRVRSIGKYIEERSVQRKAILKDEILSFIKKRDSTNNIEYKEFCSLKIAGLSKIYNYYLFVDEVAELFATNNSRCYNILNEPVVYRSLGLKKVFFIDVILIILYFFIFYIFVFVLNNLSSNKHE